MERRGFDRELCILLRTAIRRSGLTHSEIARRLEAATQHGTSTAMLDAWTSLVRANHLPAYLVPSLCDILGDPSLQRELLSTKQRELLEYGEAREKVNRREKTLEK